jgi:hypothetical protein
MKNLLIITAIIAVFVFYKIIKEIVHIRLYTFTLKLKANGKLIPKKQIEKH